MKLNDLSTFNNSIIVAPENLKRYFLYLKTKNPRLNITIFSLKELQAIAFGKIYAFAYKMLLKKGVYSLDYLNKILSLIQRGINPKCNSSVEDVYTTLVENNLIENNSIAGVLFKQYRVNVIGYSNKNIELNHVLTELNASNICFYKASDLIDECKQSFYQFKTLDDEVRFVFRSIIFENNKLIEENKKIRKKVIICEENDYKPILNLYASSYGLKLYFSSSISAVDSNLGKEMLFEILNNVNPFDWIKEKRSKVYNSDLTLLNSIEETLSKYFDYDDFNSNPQFDISFLYTNTRTLLQSIKIKPEHYENEIMVTGDISFDASKDYYVLGASDLFIPKLVKNNKIFDDSIFEINNINTSQLENIEAEDLYHAFINSHLIKHVSFYEIKGKDKLYPNNLIPSSAITEPKLLDVDYSKDVALLYVSKSIDIKNKYNEYTDDLNYINALKEMNYECDEYDSSFTGIDDHNGNNLSFSYTSLETLFSCKFKYYLKYILGLSSFEGNFSSILGTFVHKVFEGIESYDFDKRYLDVYKQLDLDNILSPQDKMMLESDKERIKKAYENIKNALYIKNSSRYEHEYSHTYLVDQNNPSLTVNGSIDNFIVLYPSNEIIVLDYKTGYYSFGDEESNNAGLDLQLHFYGYLLSKDKTYKNNKIGGMYFAPVLPKMLNTSSEDYQNFYKLDGLTFNSALIDPLFLSKNSLKTPEFDITYYNALIEKKVKEAETIVREFDFHINPYKSKKDNACKYCEYASICFKNWAKENKYKNAKETEENEDGDE